MKKAQPRQTLNGHSIFSSENAQDAYYKSGGYMAPILPMHFNKGTQIFRDTTSLPFLDGGPLVDRTSQGKIRDSIYASALGNYYPDGGQLYTYKDRPGATYQKVNGQWYINTEHTNGEFIPVKDPTGKRTALLNAKATPMATTTNKYQRTYDPLLDNKPQGGETTQQVAQNYMMAKNSEQYAEQVAKGKTQAQAEKSPEQIAKESDLNAIKNSLTPEEKALAKEYFNNAESNYYYDPTRGEGVLKGNAGEAQSFMERMDQLAWPAFQPFTGNPSFEKTKLQEFEKNKVKKFPTLNDAMRAVYAERVAHNRGQSSIELTPSEEVGRLQAMQQYQTPPGQMASGRAAPVDWLWTLPIAGPAALEMLGGLGAMSVPGMSAVPGATVGNLVNSGFIANSLMQAPSNAKSWYDVSQGKKNWQDAALESGEIAAGMIGSGAGLKSLAQDAKGVLKATDKLKDLKKISQEEKVFGTYGHDLETNPNIVYKESESGKIIPFNIKTNKSLQEEYVDNMKSYYDSPEFKRIMKEEHPNVNIEQYKKVTLENLENELTYNPLEVPEEYGGAYTLKNSSLAVYPPWRRSTFAERVNNANTNKFQILERGKSHINDPSATWHELSHQRTNADELLPNEFTRSHIEENSLPFAEDLEYYGMPTEFEVRLRQLKEDLKTQGINDYFTAPVTEEHINMLDAAKLKAETDNLFTQAKFKYRELKESGAPEETLKSVQNQYYDNLKTLENKMGGIKTSTDTQDLLARWPAKFLAEKARTLPALVPITGAVGGTALLANPWQQTKQD